MGNFLKIGSSGSLEEGREGIVGEVRMFLSTTIPSNFLLLDGSSAYDLENDYPALYALLGDSNTLPDFRDRFVRAWGATRDPNTLQDEEFKSHTHIQNAHTHIQDAHTHIQDAHTHIQNAHTHSIPARNEISAGGSTAHITYSPSYYVWTSSTTATNQNTTATNQNTTATNQNTTAINQSTGGTETRPKNISVVFAICAK